MADYRQRMSEILRPVAPPRVLEGVYTDDQHQRIRQQRSHQSRPAGRKGDTRRVQSGERSALVIPSSIESSFVRSRGGKEHEEQINQTSGNKEA